MEKIFGKIQKSDLQQPPKFKQIAQAKIGVTKTPKIDKMLLFHIDIIFPKKVDFLDLCTKTKICMSNFQSKNVYRC